MLRNIEVIIIVTILLYVNIKGCKIHRKTDAVLKKYNVMAIICCIAIILINILVVFYRMLRTV